MAVSTLLSKQVLFNSKKKNLTLMFSFSAHRLVGEVLMLGVVVSLFMQNNVFFLFFKIL